MLHWKVISPSPVIAVDDKPQLFQPAVPTGQDSRQPTSLTSFRSFNTSSIDVGVLNMQTTRAIRSTAPAIRPWNALSTPLPRATSTWGSSACLRPCSKRSFAARRVAFLNQKPRFFSTAQSNPKPSSEVYSEFLPICCPGCGAYSQTVEPNEPGYYGKQLKKIRKIAPLNRKAAAKDDKAVAYTSEVASEHAGLNAPQLDAQVEGASLHETAPIPRCECLELQQPSHSF